MLIKNIYTYGFCHDFFCLLHNFIFFLNKLNIPTGYIFLYKTYALRKNPLNTKKKQICIEIVADCHNFLILHQTSFFMKVLRLGFEVRFG